MMKRIAFLIALVAIASVAILLSAGKDTKVTLINARTVPLDGQANNFVLTFEIQNEGSAKTLISVGSTSAQAAHVMNPGYEDTPIVIPASSTGIFAMDGAHVMLMGVDADFDEGASIPITLTFENSGDVTTRALNVGNDMGEMNHDMAHGMQSIQNPSIAIEATDGFSTNGAQISVNVENFSFVRVPDDAPHVPMEGHAHIYLNGLKLGRLYETNFSLGAMPRGSYDLKVTLNTNNHQAYMQDNAPIQDVISFQLN
jgi:copper(I)-binding protein